MSFVIRASLFPTGARPFQKWIALSATTALTHRVSAPAYFPSATDLQAKGREQEGLHARASATRRAVFGTQVYLRAVVEVSNYCRENCHYCGMRRDNRSLARYRAHADQLADLLIHHRPKSITDINIQTGEDPVAVREVVLPLIAALRRETNLGISVCLGTLTPALYRELFAAGASIYIMKFELAAPDAYEQLEAPGTLAERARHIRQLATEGWGVSSGFIAGLPGQTESEALENFALANTLPLRGCSVSPFVPGDETPLDKSAAASIDLTLNSMAALRLMRPDWVIPAVSALNLAEPGAGYQRGLRTGANLVTINLTPAEVRGDYLLYKRDRVIMTEERILAAIAAEGLAPSAGSLAACFREPAPSAASWRATDFAAAPPVWSQGLSF